MTTKSKLVKPKDIKQGKTIYIVEPLEEKTKIEICFIDSKILFDGTSLYYFMTKESFSFPHNKYFYTYQYLNELNIYNTENQSKSNIKAFTTRKAAERYKKECIKHNIFYKLEKKK